MPDIHANPVLLAFIGRVDNIGFPEAKDTEIWRDVVYRRLKVVLDKGRVGDEEAARQIGRLNFSGMSHDMLKYLGELAERDGYNELSRALIKESHDLLRPRYVQAHTEPIHYGKSPLEEEPSFHDVVKEVEKG